MATKLRLAGIIAMFAWMLVGCGPSAAERAAQEKRRLDLEAKAQRDAYKANAAITTMNQKLGRKPPQLDLGLATETAPAPARGESKQP